MGFLILIGQLQQGSGIPSLVACSISYQSVGKTLHSSKWRMFIFAVDLWVLINAGPSRGNIGAYKFIVFWMQDQKADDDTEWPASNWWASSFTIAHMHIRRPALLDYSPYRIQPNHGLCVLDRVLYKTQQSCTSKLKPILRYLKVRNNSVMTAQAFKICISFSRLCWFIFRYSTSWRSEDTRVDVTLLS